tara:strand:- start:441 stop:608 length:168 start_codon:yes stop_codon:yes gene_type:complete
MTIKIIIDNNWLGIACVFNLLLGIAAGSSEAVRQAKAKQKQRTPYDAFCFPKIAR